MERENFQMIVSSFTGEESNLWKADLKGGIIWDNLEAIWEFWVDLILKFIRKINITEMGVKSEWVGSLIWSNFNDH